MNFYKKTVCLLVALIILSTVFITPIYAFSFKNYFNYFSKYNSNTYTTKKITNYTKKTSKQESEQSTQKDSETTQRVENEMKDFDNFIETQKNEYETANTSSQKWYERILSYFKNLKGNSSESLNKYLIEKIVDKYSLASSSSDKSNLVEKMYEIFKDYSYSDVKTALKQFVKAFKETNTSIPTASDATSVIEEILSGKYYHLDVDENGNKIPDNQYVTYTNIQDIARLSNYAAMGYERANGYPIAIGKASIHMKDSTTNTFKDINDVYIIALAGTTFEKDQSYGIIADILSGTESDSPYLSSAVQAMKSTIPAGSNIMLCGFSLGGMIAQQIIVNEEILQQNYNILQVVSYGCPPLCVRERDEAIKKYNIDIPVNRVINKYDLVPYLCIDYLLDKTPETISEKLYVEEGTTRYKTFLGTHCLGYLKDECWLSYDALGNKVSNDSERATITFKHEDFQYYSAPTEYLTGTFSIIE